MALYCMQPPQRKYAAEVPIFLCAAVRDKPDEKMDSLIVPKVVWRIDGMAIEKVKEYFKTYNMADRIQEFTVSSATVELAAQALHCEPCRIAKTLSFMVEGNPILIVTAGDAKIDNPKYKAKFGTKAKMLTPEEAETLVGHAVGGVCPFAVCEGVTIYLDESLKRFETVFPACGSSNSAIELNISELENYSGYQEWVDVCKLLS